MIFRFKALFIFTSLFCLQNTFAGAQNFQNICRSHFIQNDVLSKFSQDEKTKLEVAATMWVDLMGKADFQSQQAKGELNTSIENIIAKKQLNKNEKDLFKDWFKERIQYYIKSKMQSLLDATKKARDHAQQLEKQKLVQLFMVEAMDKYKTDTLSNTLIIAHGKIEKEQSAAIKKSILKDILFILDKYEQLEVDDYVLLISAYHQHLLSLKYFIQNNKNKAYLNTQDTTGKTALHYVANGSDGNLVKMLIKAGANPLLADKRGELPIHIAAKNPNIDAGAIRALLESNPKEQINLISPLIVQTPLRLAIQSRNTDVVKALLEAGADPSLKDNTGSAALHLAVTDEQVPLEILRLLLNADHGVEYSIPTNRGNYPIHLAAQNPNPEILKFLLAETYGAHLNSETSLDVNTTSENKNTPLHLAATTSIEVLKILLEAGADPTLRNKFNQTAYDVIKAVHTINSSGHAYQIQAMELLSAAMEEWKNRRLGKSPNDL